MIDNIQVPPEMDATPFEYFVWKHQTDMTVGEIKQVWEGATSDAIRAAIDKGFESGWQFLPTSVVKIANPLRVNLGR